MRIFFLHTNKIHLVCKLCAEEICCCCRTTDDSCVAYYAGEQALCETDLLFYFCGTEIGVCYLFDLLTYSVRHHLIASRWPIACTSLKWEQRHARCHQMISGDDIAAISFCAWIQFKMNSLQFFSPDDRKNGNFALLNGIALALILKLIHT